MKKLILILSLMPLTAASQTIGSTGWFAMTHKTRDRQPHWITPLATLTPLLEQEYRFDLVSQEHPAFTAWQYGAGKGLELIPTSDTELILTQPTYETAGAASGWGDTGALLKYRLAASPESDGNYVATATFSGSADTGTTGIGAGHSVLSPGFGWGKGWGDFDVQQALSASFPLSGTGILGHQITLNTAGQYHWEAAHAWPELEWNAGWWAGGARAGLAQSFITPGVVFGPFRLGDGPAALTFGVGEQTALTTFHLYNHSWIFSLRVPF